MDVESPMAWLEDAEGRVSFDVGKAWHAVHFTLTGDAWSTDGVFGDVVLGGEPFGEDVVGYGPARWLPAEAVAAAASALADLPPDDSGLEPNRRDVVPAAAFFVRVQLRRVSLCDGHGAPGLGLICAERHMAPVGLQDQVSKRDDH